MESTSTLVLWQGVVSSTGEYFQASMPFFALLFGVGALFVVVSGLVWAFSRAVSRITRR